MYKDRITPGGWILTETMTSLDGDEEGEAIGEAWMRAMEWELSWGRDSNHHGHGLLLPLTTHRHHQWTSPTDELA